MNEHIELVKRWRAGEVFSGEQLKANAEAAYAAYAAVAAHALWAASDAAHAAAYADYWVKRYEELTNDK